MGPTQSKKEYYRKRAEIVKGVIHTAIVDWARKEVTYVEDATIFNQDIKEYTTKISCQVSFGANKNSICNDAVVKLIIDRIVIGNIQKQLIFKCDKSIQLSKIEITYNYRTEWNSILYTITCHTKN